MIPTYIRSATYDMETGYPIWLEEVPYDGPWELVKKGRETEQQVAQTGLSNAKTDIANQGQQYGAENSDIDTLEANSTPGSLSPAAQAQLGADQAKIQTTYNNAKTQGLKGIAQHGMGTLTGENSSLANSLLRGQASDENAAQEQAQINTHADQLAAINARSGLQNTYNPNGSLSAGGDAAFDESRMGSTLGDVGTGLTTAASLGEDVVGMGGLNNIGGNIMNGKSG